MKREFLTFACMLLCSTACTSQLSEDGEEVLIFSSTLRYLRAHPVRGSRSQCFEERMLKRDTSKGPLLKVRDIHTFIRNDFWKTMNRCYDGREESTAGETRYQFYQPSIGRNDATIQVDFHCGDLCGGGMTYRLQRSAERPERNVTYSGMRWIS